MGVTEAGYHIATEGRSREGGSKVPAEEVGRVGVYVAVTGQQDEDQEGRGRRMGGETTSKHLTRLTRVTAADPLANAKPR